VNVTLARIAVPLLRWILGLVIIEEACRFAFSSSAAHFFLKTGLPAWLRPALGIAEAVAALLFLVPVTTLAGGYALLAVFTLAAVIHVLHGQFEIGGLVVYAAAVLVCITRNAKRGTP